MIGPATATSSSAAEAPGSSSISRALMGGSLTQFCLAMSPPTCIHHEIFTSVYLSCSLLYSFFNSDSFSSILETVKLNNRIR